MNNNPVTVVITCSIQPGKVDMARQALEENIKMVMYKEPACHGIRVHDDPKNPQRLLIIEYWDSAAIFTGPHMQTPHMQTFLKTAEQFLDGTAEFGFWREIIVGN
ncbi:antibiotic biosynthesis monooxygenase [Niabella ginsenosidivorans]|uniref:Antibiotic biosynthesis monooxygenase n=1 Tax=Niabella ginsenosidivorans TaxID=1176587 RepID=A0A1A9I6R3_9BACT|nr:putative quinol monooxygenase [Niabella ginsenosidivorans]ANH83306.1 antibiotic biosynthesis monooxygenase [Niabella ginsenosidivorans]